MVSKEGCVVWVLMSPHDCVARGALVAALFPDGITKADMVPMRRNAMAIRVKVGAEFIVSIFVLNTRTSVP